MEASIDIVVIGAGPAGLSAARSARDDGLSVVLLDEQPEPGGQIWRAVGRVSETRPADLSLFGASYEKGVAAVSDLQGIDTRFGATVWQVEQVTSKWRVTFSQKSTASRVETAAVVIATGAQERSVPIPGWTLPGVTTVGALQLGLKQSGIYPSGKVVLAGGGPLPLLLASQLKAARVPVSLTLDTSPVGRLGDAAAHLPGAVLGAADTLLDGLKLLRIRDKSGVPVVRGAVPIAVEGDGKAERLRYRDGSGEHVVDADTVALHEGVVPNTQLTRSIGLKHIWNVDQRCFHPVLGEYGETERPNLFVAGDGGGILGWRAAVAAGRLAAAEIAFRWGVFPESARDLRAFQLHARLNAERRLRRFLDALYPPPEWLRHPEDDVVVCRCEEITAGRVRELAALGDTGPNQLKTYSRAGMGPCQSRMCGLTVAEVLADAGGVEPDAVGLMRVRAPIKPVTVDELASLHDSSLHYEPTA